MTTRRTFTGKTPSPLFTREDHLRIARMFRKDALFYQAKALDPQNARAGHYEDLARDHWVAARRHIARARYAPSSTAARETAA